MNLAAKKPDSYELMGGPSQAGSGIRPMMTSWKSWKQIAAFGLAAAVCACGACAAANPYGIAGTGVLTKLGMPSGCSEYNWNVLQPSNPINMVRVWGHYYDYNKITDTIVDATQFASWVTANPGKTWIIGNEPDHADQDNLTTDQYARMFHCYYTLIKPLDPTARFAICGHSGGSTAAGLTNVQNWYQQVLTTYQTLYGTNMPIDVWNVHSYCGPGQIEDPDKIINEFVSPFVLWCHTVQSGAYASCPVWITEGPVGEWNGAMSPENVIYFMQLYMPRLEQAGIEKWFWFVSDNCNGYFGCQGSCVLTDPSGQVTSVGWAYSALANSYPNAVPPIVPFVPYPAPETVRFDFSGDFGRPWFNKGGWWSNTNGELRHTGIYPWFGTVCCPLYVYQDFGLSFRMKINSAPTNANWGAVLLRAASRLHTHVDSGYLFFIRKNGEAGLYNKVDEIVVSVPGAVADPTVYHNYQVYVSGFRIQCYIDGIKKIDWTDPNARYASGYVSALVYKADASYDDFALAKFPGCTPGNLVNADFEGGNTGGVATGWTGYQRAGSPTPTNVWSIQTASPPPGGGTNYQQIANTSSTGGGGVRQDITGCIIGATYTIASWIRGNSVNATCTVKCSPSASTNWSTAIDLNPPQTYTGPNWTAFSGTVVATGTNMTLWLDGQTGGSGLNKAECFDSVTVTCAPAPAPFRFETVTWLPEDQARLVLSGTPGGRVTIQRSSNLVDWLALTNLINTNGTLQLTDASATNSPQRFYRATSP